MSEDATICAETEARGVMSVLKEYAEKLSALNSDLMTTRYGYPNGDLFQRAALLLDISETIRKPLARILSRGSALLEHPVLDSFVEDELALRVREIEIHYHHLLRLTHELRQFIDESGEKDQVARLRYAAGLNGMKGGPLRPNP